MTPRSRGVGTPRVGRPADYLPQGTVGQWLPAPCNGGPCTRAATQEPTRRGRLGSRAGIPKRTRPKLPTNVLLSNQRGLQHTKRGGGPKTPHCEGKGPENPGVVAPFAVAGCRGNLRRGGPIRYDVAASHYLLWYDMGGRSHAPAFSSHYWTSLSRAILSSTSPPQIFASLQRTISGVRGQFTFSSAVVFQLQIASFDTPSVRENAAQFLFWVSLVLWRSTLTNGWETEDQRSLAFVSQFLLVSGLVWNRHSDISVPRTCAMYTGCCPLAKHVLPLDRSHVTYVLAFIVYGRHC